MPRSSTLKPPPFTSLSPPSVSHLENPPRPPSRKQNSFSNSGELSDSSEDDSVSSSSSTTSLPLVGPGLLPPYYNRPPTPLPSPSLTSLLRPPFTPSRPTTPDSSDSEAVATSSRIAQSTPRASPKVPTYEYFGFVLYLVSSLAFVIYLIWSFSPSPLLHAMGIHYYPNRWWSLALPSWLVVLVVYIYVALAAYNTGYLTRGLSEIECVVDGAAQVAAINETTPAIAKEESPLDTIPPISLSAGREGVKRARSGSCYGERWQGNVCGEVGDKDWKGIWGKGTDAVMDIPVGGVCEVLYGEGREREEWELDDEAHGIQDNAAAW